MALEMQEEQYLAFYKDSMLGYSKAYQKYAIRQLKQWYRGKALVAKVGATVPD